MRRTLSLLVAAALVLPLFWTAAIDDAVAGSTQTGTLRGKVVDENGQPLPGVTVIVRSEALIRERATVTDADGGYFVANLPPGKYTVVTQLTGYLTLLSDTEVQIDQTTLMPRTVMKEGELSETVTVTATKPIVDKTASEKSTVIDKTITEKLPAGRSYQSLVQYAPGVTGGSNPNVLGGTSNSNIYLYDGVSTRDPVTGTFGANLNYDAIESVDVKLTGISAEYGQFQGGLVNVLTKQGGNDWTGSVRDVVDAPSWTSLFSLKSQERFKKGFAPGIPSRTQSQDDKTHRISTTLGGPVVTDNAWFYVSYDRVSTVQSLPLGNPTGGVNGDGTYTRTFDGNNSLGKATWQITNDHKVQYFYSEDPATVPRCYYQLFFGGPCYDTWAVDNQNQGGFLWVGNWNSTWTSNVVSDVKVTKFKNTFLIVPLTPPGPGTQAGLPRSGTGDVGATIDLISGGGFDAPVFSNDPDARNREQYEAAVTTFFDTSGAGSHTIKIGADYQKQDRVGQSIIAGNALFYFSFVNPPAGLGGNGAPYDPLNRSYYFWLDFAPPGTGGPLNKYTAIYVNDDWQLNDHFSFNLGIRFEKSDNQNDVGEKIIDDSGYAPRLGMVWDVTAQGKHLIKATAARYLAGINLTTISPFIRAAGGQSSYDFYVNFDYPAPPSADLNGDGTINGSDSNWVLISQSRPDPDVNQFENGLKPQLIDEYTLGYDWGITPTIGVGIQGVYRKWDEIITQQNGFDYSTGPARKLLFFRNNSDAKRDYKGVILRFDKRLANNWQMGANYTYSRSEGNVTSDSGFDTYGNYAGVPQAFNNREGKLPWDSTHAFKLQAYYSVPLKSNRHGLSFGAIYDYRSGFPFAGSATTNIVVGPGPNGIQDVPLGSPTAGGSDDQRDNVTTFYEKRGTHRAPFNQQLDLSANWTFAFNPKVNFSTAFEVFNVTNENHATAVNAAYSSSTGLPASTFGFPTSYSQIQLPRSYRLNFALTW